MRIAALKAIAGASREFISRLAVCRGGDIQITITRRSEK